MERLGKGGKVETLGKCYNFGWMNTERWKGGKVRERWKGSM